MTYQPTHTIQERNRKDEIELAWQEAYPEEYVMPSDLVHFNIACEEAHDVEMRDYWLSRKNTPETGMHPWDARHLSDMRKAEILAYNAIMEQEGDK